jgi:hypothetical protein
MFESQGPLETIDSGGANLTFVNVPAASGIKGQIRSTRTLWVPLLSTQGGYLEMTLILSVELLPASARPGGATLTFNPVEASLDLKCQIQKASLETDI